MMKRYTLYLKEEQLATLKKKAAETHILVSELIRLAITASLSAVRDSLAAAIIRQKVLNAERRSEEK